MYPSLLTFTTATLFALNALPTILGAIYVIDPLQSTTCHAGQNCTVQWDDDGIQPLLTSIGACTVGLYHGEMELVQEIEPVDVSVVHSLQFIPNPKAGPTSSQYFISFQSTNYSVNGTLYRGYSTSFKIDQMTGSFNSPVPSLTSSISIPTSVLSPTPNEVSSTEFVGGATLPGPASTSTSPSLSSTSGSVQTPASGSSNPPTSSGATQIRISSMPLAGILLLSFGISYPYLY